VIKIKQKMKNLSVTKLSFPRFKREKKNKSMSAVLRSHELRWGGSLNSVRPQKAQIKPVLTFDKYQ
jgi:hypothetical protein